MKIKKYIECYIPTETCNLRCSYCYITQKRKFNSKIVKFPHKARKIREALSVERLGGTCLLNLCAGGETLLGDEIVPLIKELLEEGHYLMVVTNGTLTKKFDEIIEFPKELLERLIFKFSFHYLELMRIGKIDEFFNNIKSVKNAGCSFTVELTPSDELIPHISEIQRMCIDKLGVLCQVTIARNDTTKNIDVLSSHSFEEYVNIWSVFKSDLFKFKSTIFYKKRNEFCYAGEWSLYTNLVTGLIRQCYCGVELGNLYENIEKPLKTLPIGKNCSLPHCYNGHAFLTLGAIPELESPSYDQMRNRINNDGISWLQPSMQNFIGQKLKDNNFQYNESKKLMISRKVKLLKIAKFPSRVIKGVKRRLEN